MLVYVFEMCLFAEWVENNRDEAKALSHCRGHHFGGTWTAVHVGSVCDKVGGVPSTPAAKNMLRRWSLNREFGNSVELYGLENARLLACAWCHRFVLKCLRFVLTCKRFILTCTGCV